MDSNVIKHRRRYVWCIWLILGLAAGYVLFGLYLKLSAVFELKNTLTHIKYIYLESLTDSISFSPDTVKISYQGCAGTDEWRLIGAYNNRAKRVEMTLNGKNNTLLGFYIGKNDAGVAIDKNENIYYTFPCKNIKASWEQCMLSDLLKIPRGFPDFISNEDIIKLFSKDKSVSYTTRKKTVKKTYGFTSDVLINGFMDLNINRSSKNEFKGDISFGTAKRILHSAGIIKNEFFALIQRLSSEYIKDTDRVYFHIKSETKNNLSASIFIKNIFVININMINDNMDLSAYTPINSSFAALKIYAKQDEASGRILCNDGKGFDFKICYNSSYISVRMLSSYIPGTVNIIFENRGYYPFEDTELTLQTLGSLKLNKVLKLARQLEG